MNLKEAVLSKRALSILAAAAVLAAASILYSTGWADKIGSRAELQKIVEALGPIGPLAIIGFMAAAIIFSPIPSAPIAMAAGALYGPLLGGAYVVAGAELGAIVAFLIARFLAYDLVRSWGAARQVLEHLEQTRSQNWLAAVVFASRLVPFISFDAVSYAAGLTPITFWRFAFATLLGITPISFLLAYGGEALANNIAVSPLLTVLALGGVTAVPLLAASIWKRFKGRTDS